MKHESIVKMTKAGLGQGLIVSMIQNQPGRSTLTPDGLVKLKQNKVAREFRPVTGAVMHVSGGATRDLVPFESKKAANRMFMFKVVLPNLGAGEYGFLPPGAASSASIGKMYSFRLLE